MKYNYRVEVKDRMMDNIMVLKCESDTELTKSDIIKKWSLDGSDIEWYKIYKVIDGEKIQV